MATILLIDDDEQVRTLFQVVLAGAGYRVLVANNGKHGLRRLDRQEVDLMLVDILMPDIDGLELIPRLRRMRPPCKIVAMSGGSREWDYLDTAKQLGANATLKKPFGPQELLDLVGSQLGEPLKPACPQCGSEHIYRMTEPPIGGTDIPFGPPWFREWKTCICAPCQHQWPVSESEQLLNPTL